MVPYLIPKAAEWIENDVDEADTAASLDKRRSAIWIFGDFGDFARISNRQTALVQRRSAVLLILL